MPSFRYKAVATNGSLVKGEIVAPDRSGAAASLQQLGQVPLQIDPSEPQSGLWAILSRDIKLGRRSEANLAADLMVRISLLLDSGVALEAALALLASTEGAAAARSEAAALLTALRGGAGLGDAMAARGAAFSPVVVAMVRAGEASGTLAPTLNRLSDHLARAAAVRQSIRSALVYPAVLLITALGSVLVILLVVLPQLEPVFADSGTKLPTLTAAAFVVSGTLRDEGWALLAAAGLAAWLTRRAFSDPRLRARRDAVALKLPVLGLTIRRAETGRFARVLGTLVLGGVGLASALVLAQPVLNNRVMADALAKITAAVREGDSLAEPLARAGILPDLAVQLIRIGEKTGRLGPMLLRLADLLEAEVQHTVDRGLALLVPCLTIGMGGLIAGIISSVMMAVLSVNDMAH